MANRIKGITVEIGGDTTKFQTTLKGVTSSIKDSPNIRASAAAWLSALWVHCPRE